MEEDSMTWSGMNCPGCGQLLNVHQENRRQPCPRCGVMLDGSVSAQVREPRTPWIGVDWDGTLVEWTDWTAWNHFGPPIAPMVARVRRWLDAGLMVRIVTARVHNDLDVRRCRSTKYDFTAAEMVLAIADHSQKIIGTRLPVQCHKDCDMLELWDDRAVQVETNTGRVLGRPTRPETTEEDWLCDAELLELEVRRLRAVEARQAEEVVRLRERLLLLAGLSRRS